MRNNVWNEAENNMVAALWVKMATHQYTGDKLVKAHEVKAITDATGRGRCSVEAKLMNLSAVAVKLNLTPWLENGYVKGYKPAPNYQKSLEIALQVALFASEHVIEIEEAEEHYAARRG